MVRVLLIMGNMGLGGAETQVMKIYRAINRNKVQFDFCINSKEKGYYESEIIQLGGKIYKTPKKSEQPIQYFKMLFVLCKQYDVVLKCSENASAWMEMLIAKLVGTRIRAVRSTNTKISSKGLPLLAHYLGRPFLNAFTNCKLAPGKEAGEWLFGKKRSDIRILPNGIDTQLFAFSEFFRTQTRNELGINDEIVFGTVGRMSEQKNQLFLIDIFHGVHSINPNTKLLIVGDGELRKKLEEKIIEYGLEESIILTGKSNRVPQLLMAMDVFCLPSLYEGMPNCAIEAQGTGLKCILSDTVTREANITGNVIYKTLDQTLWIKTLLEESETSKTNERVYFVNKIAAAGYDVNVIAERIENQILKQIN